MDKTYKKKLEEKGKTERNGKKNKKILEEIGRNREKGKKWEETGRN